MNNDRMFYTFDNNGEVVAHSINEYLTEMRKNPIWNNAVAKDKINGCHISTVLLSVEHGHDNKNDPIIFETLIFTRRCGIWRGIDQMHYFRATKKEQAKKIHKVVCELVKRKRITQIKRVAFAHLLSSRIY